MFEIGRNLLERLFLNRLGERDLNLHTPNPHTVHYTELPSVPPGEPLALEWNLYRRLVGTLLNAGHQGRWVLLKDEELLGIFDTQAEALATGYQRFLRQPFLVHQIQERDRLLRAGWQRLCPH
ncbi:MAG: hypothetical protein JNM56_09900 [Planctomycetia bacterium]|nr:hypothetical protein [Planctomycetia bacterium]